MGAIELVGYCGLYCGACTHHRSSFRDGAHLLEELQPGTDTAGYQCQGCRSAKLNIHPGCRECKIRACATAKGFEHCGACPELPCQMMRDFVADGHVHHLDVLDRLAELNQSGSAAWLSEQRERWTCECGREYSWYEKSCRNCGADLRCYPMAVAP